MVLNLMVRSVVLDYEEEQVNFRVKKMVVIMMFVKVVLKRKRKN